MAIDAEVLQETVAGLTLSLNEEFETTDIEVDDCAIVVSLVTPDGERITVRVHASDDRAWAVRGLLETACDAQAERYNLPEDD